MEYKNINEIVKEKYWIMPATPKFIEKKEIPYITSKNIKNGKINFENVKYISKEDYAKLIKNRKIKKDDMLISMIGTLGEIAIVNEEDFPFYGQNVYLIRLNQSIVDNKYFYYFFNSDRIKHYLQSKKNSSTQGYIKTAHIESIKIPLYNMDKQKEIVSNLNKVKMIISKQKEQLELLENLKKSRFIEMFGDPIRNEKRWDKIFFQEITNKIGDGLHGTPKYDVNGTIPFINGNNLIEGKIVIQENTKFVNEVEYKKYFKEMSINTVFLSINGTLGRLAFYNNEKIVLGKSVCFLDLKKEINRVFVYYLLKNKRVVHKLEENSTKSTIKNISLKYVRNFNVICPPLTLQNEFASFVTKTNKLKFRKLKSLEKTENSKIIQKFLALK